MPQGLYTTATAGMDSLCVTCIHSGGCSLHMQNQDHVVECNEFESVRGLSQSETAQILVFPKTNACGELDLKLGLCVTCLSRNTCTYAKPATGVWHCEEYR